MLVLHGTWVPAGWDAPARFALWGEVHAGGRSGAGSRPARRVPPAGRGTPWHAAAAGVDVLLAAGAGDGDPSRAPGYPGHPGLIQDGQEALGQPCEVYAWLPSVPGAPLPSPSAAAGDLPGDWQEPVLAPWRLPALALTAPVAAERLLTLGAAGVSRPHTATSPADGPPTQVENVVVGDDLRFWIVATRFALELVYRQRLLPLLCEEGQRYAARWRPLLEQADDRRRADLLAGAMPAVCRALAWRATGDQPAPPPSRSLLEEYVAAVVDGVARAGAATLRRPSIARGRPATGGRRIHEARDGGAATAVAAAWWDALGGPPLLEMAPSVVRGFETQLRAWARGGTLETAPAADTFRVCFRLEPPEPEPPEPEPPELEPPEAQPLATGSLGTGSPGGGSPAASQNASPWTLRFLLQASDDPSLLVPAGEVWRQRGATARFLNRRLEQPQERLLAGLGRAARLFPPIEASLRAARPETCPLSPDEAHRFLRETALLLRASGFGVLVPGLESRLRLRIRVGGAPADPARGSGRPTFTWDSLVGYDWQVALGDETLTREEFEHLARLKEPLVQVRGRWVELDPGQVERALACSEGAPGGGELSLQDALKRSLATDSIADRAGLPVASVEAQGWLDDLLRALRRQPDGRRRETVAEPSGFAGPLRPYQKAGVSGLATLQRYGLGACLADDMGLGKTVQLIALLLHTVDAPGRNARGRGRRGGKSVPQGAAPPALPLLLVCPTSVVGNWRRELARFAPSLRVLVHHGAGRAKAGLEAEVAGHDVVISTYALLHRDEAALASVEWGAVALDEAQNVKNAATKAAGAARTLRTRWRVALTGTPVENRLSELWSIFHFLNPGYLGSAEEFRRRFGNPIERANDAAATARLKALTAPFILRRVKTDRTIIQDLPEKNEMKVFCSLTREQATLYEATVRDQLRQIEAADGVQRRGAILATLTKLKQVCDHPALFLQDGSALAGRSGKLARLEEMLEEALAVDDRALLFTQYAEMGKLLKTHLEERFGGEVLLLHGGTPVAERDRLVARFQRPGPGPRLFVLSIKAGGTGLNLTNANHVFHFDRWWNPAVENQATDRAFRIGQRRDVQVHKFVCAGTFEETIDGLIERKVALAEAIVGPGERWITELSTAELSDLFALRRDAAADVMAAG